MMLFGIKCRTTRALPEHYQPRATRAAENLSASQEYPACQIVNTRIAQPVKLVISNEAKDFVALENVRANIASAYTSNQ